MTVPHNQCQPIIERAIRDFCRKSPGFPDLSLTAMAKDIADAVGVAQASPDHRLTEDMTLAHNARKAAIEECKRLIEEGQETFSETHEGSRRHLTPRKHGNSAGLAYADGIGALSAVTPSPGPGERADRLEDERNRLQNSYGSGPFADGLITRRIAEIDKELSSLSSTDREGK